MEKGSFSKPTETLDLSGMGTLEVVRVGDTKVSRMTLRPGWRWSAHVKPIVGGDSCQSLHHGFVTSGRLAVRMDDGSEEEFAVGDVWIIPPTNPPGRPSARPDDLDRLARCHGEEDEVVVGGRDASRRDECCKAAEGGHQVRSLGGDVQASRARWECRTGPQGAEPQGDYGKKDDEPTCQGRNDSRLSSAHHSILILRCI